MHGQDADLALFHVGGNRRRQVGQRPRRDVFEELGGYPDWPILEDVDFIRRLARRGKLGIVEATVVTDARRFEARGKVRTVAVNWLIWTLFASGVSPHRLARLYRHVR